MKKIIDCFVNFLSEKLPDSNVRVSYASAKKSYPQITVDCVQKNSAVAKSRCSNFALEILIETQAFKDKDKINIDSLFDQIGKIFYTPNLEHELSTEEVEILFINCSSTTFDCFDNIFTYMLDIEVWANV
ncbi:hypothetical protein AAEX28_04195 [Lentisphaerota bacterium WC36G]|nr:hypothetical protein LJT99_07065 [Lentisphaerae bacterium WC36]